MGFFDFLRPKAPSSATMPPGAAPEDYMPAAPAMVMDRGEANDDLGRIGAGSWPDVHFPDGREGPVSHGNTDQDQTDLPATPVTQPSAHTRAFRIRTAPGETGKIPGLFGGDQRQDTEPEGGTWTGHELAGAPAHPIVDDEHGPGFAGLEGNAIRQVGGFRFVDETVASYAATARANAFVVPDPRRIADGVPDGDRLAEDTAGYPFAGRQFDTSPEAVHSETEDVDQVDVTTPPDRPRAGAAGPDEGRPARAEHWFTMRPFDQWATHNLTGIRGTIEHPRASTPVFTHTEAPGKAPAAGMDPLALHPNTWRLTPQPWDQDLVDAGMVAPATVDTTLADVARRRVAGWRARGDT